LKTKLPVLGLVLVLSTLIASGCTPSTAQPTAVPTIAPTEPPTEVPAATPTEAAVEVPDPARARDAALATVSQNYSEQAPAPNLAWAEETITPEGLVGSSTFQYTADDWGVTVSFPVVAPQATIYNVVVANQATGFRWEGEVDATGEVTEQAVEVVEYDYEGWETYTSEKFGYTLRYPAECAVMGADPDASVQFVGPVVGDEHWPWFFVDHYDSDFYRPPAGTDVDQWIADSGMPYEEIGPEVKVAGLPTVHTVYKGGPGAYDSDDYYFIRGDQLFRISILHAGGKQDWELYDQFLRSFTFR
jgi:hypothetical protein